MIHDFRDVRVLVTGHTGFKGSWLTAWLKSEGAAVTGLALPPEPGSVNLFEAAAIADGMASVFGDIRDLPLVRETVARAKPEIIFHLAAQPLVRRSYADPTGTFATNVMGTVNVLEAARCCGSVRAFVCVTTDKVYQDREWTWGYRETDRLGGKDPYSASKACAELVAACYRQTMLGGKDGTRLATVRGGNVIGGGDWSEDRLIPDIVRSIIAGEPVVLRNPNAIRPWQHVLELVHAYLTLGGKLLDGEPDVDCAWNFGPEQGSDVSVEALLRAFLQAWGTDIPIEIRRSDLPETQVLRLDASKARALLEWKPRLDVRDTIDLTARWYQRFHAGNDPRQLVSEAIDGYRQRGRPA